MEKIQIFIQIVSIPEGKTFSNDVNSKSECDRFNLPVLAADEVKRTTAKTENIQTNSFILIGMNRLISLKQLKFGM